MSTLQIVLAATVVVLAVLAWLGLRGRGGRPTEKPADRIDTVIGWPPQATRVLSTPERMAFATLTRALPDHIVLAQVPLARFLNVPKRNSYADWLRRVGYQSVDFVICDLGSKVLAVVELQALPAGERARKRMTRISRTLNAAQIPLHVWNEATLPSAEVARAALMPAPLSTPLQPAEPESPRVEPAVPAVPAIAPGPRVPSPFEDSARDSTHDERIEFLEPPPTWYDDLDSGRTPLDKPSK